MLRRNEAAAEQPAEGNDFHHTDLGLVGKVKNLGTSSATIARLQLKRLCRQTFGTDWEARLACIRSGTASTSALSQDSEF